MTEEKTSSEQFETFLSDEPEENVEYIVPNIELKLSKAKRQECRDILLEVRNFGVSQRQILYLIYLLSLELEDNVTMKALVKAVGENRDKFNPDSPVGSESKLILESE